MNNQDRIDRLNQMISDDLIIRYKWVDQDSEGRERACLLAALSPEVAEAESSEFCPASLMPVWLAYLTPWMDDNVSDVYWPKMIREYAWMISQIHLLSEEKLNQLDYECRLIAVEEARSHVSEKKHEVLKAIDDVILLLKRASKGEAVSEGEWQVARWTAAAAEGAAEAAWAATADEATDRIVKKMLLVFRQEIELVM